MIASIFSFVQSDIREDYSIPDLRDKLFKCGALKSFETLYDDYGEDADRIVTYLIFAYSFDSSFVVAGEDWLETKKGIMESLKMDCEKFKEVLEMKRQSVKSAIIYLSKEVKDWKYYQILVWKESCQILDAIATTLPDTKSKGGSKNIADANKASYETKLKIAQLENEVRQQTKSTGRLKEVQGLNIENLSMEKILKSIK